MSRIGATVLTSVNGVTDMTGARATKCMSG